MSLSHGAFYRSSNWINNDNYVLFVVLYLNLLIVGMRHTRLAEGLWSSTDKARPQHNE